MGTCVLIALAVWAGYSIYRAGKRTGSIKGFNVGRHKRRR